MRSCLRKAALCHCERSEAISTLDTQLCEIASSPEPALSVIEGAPRNDSSHLLFRQPLRHSRQVFLLLTLLGPIAGLLGGCSFGGRPQPTRLYVLTALPETEAVTTQAALQIAIGVGPIVLPEYVDRPQIVTGNSGPELHRAAAARWAEPLADNFTRVLAENLSLLLATDHVTVFPWKGPLPMDYQVIVEVTRFLGETGGEVSLVALWSIVGKNNKDVLARKKSSFTEPTEAHDYAALAAAMSRTVTALSRDIATTIATLSQQASPR